MENYILSWNDVKQRYLEFHRMDSFTENMAIDIDFGYWLVNNCIIPDVVKSLPNDEEVNMDNKDKIHNMASCMLSILDSLKLYDNDSLLLDNETLSEVMFRKMKAYNIDLNKELGFTHLKPISKNEL